MRVLVLGGTRFVGPQIVRQLVGDGHQVAIFHRGEREPELPRVVHHVHGDFSAFADYCDELRELEPEVIVDVVPFRAKAGFGIDHFSGVAERGVVLSSGDVYRAFARVWRSEPGPPDPVPLTEESPLREKPAPDLTEEIDYDNVEVERMAEANEELPTTVLRLGVIFGPGDPFHRLYRYVKRMDDRRPAIMVDAAVAKWRWSRVYVANVAVAVALAVRDRRAAGRTYNVAGPAALSELEWVGEIARSHGWRGEIMSVPGGLLPEPARIGMDTSQDIVLDSTRIRTELGYQEIVPLEEGLRQTIEWERAHAPSEISFDYEAENAALDRLRW